MSLEQELVARVNGYIGAQASFEELVLWETEHETELTALGPKSIGAKLASAISLTAWELREGHRAEESVRDAVAEELAQIVGAASRT